MIFIFGTDMLIIIVPFSVSIFGRETWLRNLPIVWLGAEVKLGTIYFCLSRSLLAFSRAWQHVYPHRPLVADPMGDQLYHSATVAKTVLSLSAWAYERRLLFFRMKNISPGVPEFSNSQIKFYSIAYTFYDLEAFSGEIEK